MAALLIVPLYFIPLFLFIFNRQNRSILSPLAASDCCWSFFVFLWSYVAGPRPLVFASSLFVTYLDGWFHIFGRRSRRGFVVRC